ncbi:hypothetical protein BS78_05G205100 [Paspalum vaginatum]|nr:hypothetical protein BS78_05G205100 [Paspalum vaginatum]
MPAPRVSPRSCPSSSPRVRARIRDPRPCTLAKPHHTRPAAAARAPRAQYCRELPSLLRRRRPDPVLLPRSTDARHRRPRPALRTQQYLALPCPRSALGLTHAVRPPPPSPRHPRPRPRRGQKANAASTGLYARWQWSSLVCLRFKHKKMETTRSSVVLNADEYTGWK